MTEPDFDEADDGCSLPLIEHLPAANPTLLSSLKAKQMAAFFGTLADVNRLRILSLLVSQEYCVGDIAAILAMSESAVSHQLRVLRVNRLVDYRRQGRHIFYRLDDNHIADFYHAIIAHLEHL
ncbi:metalloregulator ArsR/SmtB family transcription factor [Synechocystis sp. LKSZ1]|uniref:ArsR/SmtB family transcription factor n=1 Tax=Synechocystis sp. LKSZ1 TaxID=3144951 RepID=UPI00336C2DC0